MLTIENCYYNLEDAQQRFIIVITNQKMPNKEGNLAPQRYLVHQVLSMSFIFVQGVSRASIFCPLLIFLIQHWLSNVQLKCWPVIDRIVVTYL